MKSRLGTDGSENKKGVMGANSVVGHWKNDRWCWITGCWISVVMLFLRVVAGQWDCEPVAEGAWRGGTGHCNRLQRSWGFWRVKEKQVGVSCRTWGKSPFTPTTEREAVTSKESRLGLNKKAKRHSEKVKGLKISGSLWISDWSF